MRARALAFVNAEWAVPMLYMFVKETMMDVINGAIATIIEKEIALLTWLIEKLRAKRSITIDRQEETCALEWPHIPTR